MASRTSLGWYLKRLRVMGPVELCHRVAALTIVKMLEARYKLGLPFACYGRNDIVRFTFCRNVTTQLPTLPWKFEPDGNTVESILAGRLMVLGHSWIWEPNATIWRKAPDTSKDWPKTFFGNIPYRAGNCYGDVRVAWEPSRLQHLVALALIARHAEPQVRQRAVALIEAQLLSWTGSNPYLAGIHYISAMECGLRLLAVCHTVDLIRGTITNPDLVWPTVLNLVRNHADLIRRRLSVHSSRGNHTVAECAALIYAGSLFPEMEQAALWLSLGLSQLAIEASHQILADGGGAEQAVWYQRFTSDLLGLVCMLLDHQKRQVPPVIRDALHRSEMFLHTFTGHHATIPGIGDCDNGYALSPYLIFSKEGESRAPGLKTFHDSGYSVLQSAYPLAAHMIFDHGFLGLTPCYAHGHADALSVVLSTAGQEVLLDTGTYTYNGDQEWRRYFRGTRAHNTVVVDSLDQAVQETTFMWSEPYHAELIHKEESNDGSVFLVARHDGYVKRTGVTHWRAITYIPPGFWLVWDHLTGQGEHQLELNWHLGIQPSVTADRYLLEAGQWLVSVAIVGGETKLHCGKTNPIIGWRSERYGQKKPITTIQTEYAGRLPHEFVTRIAIGPQEPPADSISHWLTTARRLVDETKTR